MPTPLIVDGRVIGSVTDPDVNGNVYYVIDQPNFFNPASVPGAVKLIDSGFSADRQHEALIYTAQNLRQSVTQLPAEAAGLHWYKDRLYAVAPTAYYVISPPTPTNFIVMKGGSWALLTEENTNPVGSGTTVASQAAAFIGTGNTTRISVANDRKQAFFISQSRFAAVDIQTAGVVFAGDVTFNLFNHPNYAEPMAYSPALGKVFIGSAFSSPSIVKVYDVAGAAFLPDYSAGSSPAHVFVDDAINKLIVANFNSGDITIMDASTGGNKITVGGTLFNCYTAAYDYDRHELIMGVADTGVPGWVEGVTVVNAQTGFVSPTIATNPAGVNRTPQVSAYDPVRRIFYCSFENDLSTIAAVNIAASTVQYVSFPKAVASVNGLSTNSATGRLYALGTQSPRSITEFDSSLNNLGEISLPANTTGTYASVLVDESRNQIYAGIANNSSEFAIYTRIDGGTKNKERVLFPVSGGFFSDGWRPGIANIVGAS